LNPVNNGERLRKKLFPAIYWQFSLANQPQNDFNLLNTYSVFCENVRSALDYRRRGFSQLIKRALQVALSPIVLSSRSAQDPSPIQANGADSGGWPLTWLRHDATQSSSQLILWALAKKL